MRYNALQVRMQFWPVSSSATAQQQVRKALALWSENPANFHQAACVFLLGERAIVQVPAQRGVRRAARPLAERAR
jgi:hypothetical protein